VTRVRLFVYGSLKRGGKHHDELAGAVWIGAVSTAPRYGVITSGGYPALVAGSSSVSGELYGVTLDALPVLDAFEGPGYRRALVELVDGSQADAYFSAVTERA